MKVIIICLLFGLLGGVMSGFFPKHVSSVSAEIVTACTIMMSFSVAISVFLISRIPSLQNEIAEGETFLDKVGNQKSPFLGNQHLLIQRCFFYFSMILIVLMVILSATMSQLPDNTKELSIYFHILSGLCGFFSCMTFSIFAFIPNQIQKLHDEIYSA